MQWLTRKKITVKDFCRVNRHTSQCIALKELSDLVEIPA